MNNNNKSFTVKWTCSESTEKEKLDLKHTLTTAIIYGHSTVIEWSEVAAATRKTQNLLDVRRNRMMTAVSKFLHFLCRNQIYLFTVN